MFTKTETAAQKCSTMETIDHSKNGVSPKNHRSRGKFKAILLMLSAFLLAGNVYGQSWYIGWPTDTYVTAILSGDESNKTLTISYTGPAGGSGAMRDFGNDTSMPWYSEKDNITTVIINYGVTSIGSCAFEDHTNLSSVRIPSSITSTGSWTFTRCASLVSITLPSSIVSISQESFRDCINLTTINCNNPIPPSIGYLSFRGVPSSCKVYVPSGSYCEYKNSDFSDYNIVEKDEWTVLCIVFTNVQTDVLNKITFEQYEEICGLYIDEYERFVENAVPSLDLKITVFQNDNLIFASKNENGHYTLPPNSDMISILDGYNYKNYDDVIIAADLTAQENTGGGVGVGFHWPGLHYSAVMLLPQTFGCDYLVELFYHEWMHSLEWWFTQLGYTVPGLHDSESYGYNIHDWHWYHAYLSNTLTGGAATGIHPEWWKYSPTCKFKPWSIGKINECDIIATFDNGTLTITGAGAMMDWNSENSMPWNCIKDEIINIVIESKVTTIGERAFTGCSKMISVDFPSNMNSIGGWAFKNTALEEVNLPNSINYIGKYAFESCVTSINIPISLTTISEGVFIFSKLTSIDFPNSITSIEGRAFERSSLKHLKIPKSVTIIGEWAFTHCYSLIDVDVKWDIPLPVPQIHPNAFENKNIDVKLYVPCGTEDLYRVAPVWEKFNIIICNEMDEILTTSIQIHPNPARTELHITLPTQAPADYTIFNPTGQTMQQGALPQSSTINVESLPSGMYFLRISGTTVKFVKR